MGVETIASVTDGTSNTIAVGEFTTNNYNTRRVFWAYGYTSYDIGTVPEFLGHPQQHDQLGQRRLVMAGSWDVCKRAFGSTTGRVELCGRRRLGPLRPPNDNKKVLIGLATVAGGEIISSDSY